MALKRLLEQHEIRSYVAPETVQRELDGPSPRPIYQMIATVLTGLILSFLFVKRKAIFG